MPDQEELLQSIESNLGLPPGFCIRLVDEDDWPFVIKLHALLESAASDFLTRALGRKELADIFTRIEMSNSRTGKIAFIRELKLLPPAHTKFIENLSQIRNQLAHKIGNFGFSIVEHFKAEKVRLKEKEFAAFVRKWAFGFEIIGEDHRSEPLAHHVMRIAPKSEGPEGFKLNRGHLLLAQPKMTILWSALAILEAMSLSNLFGPQMWAFVMECSDQKECQDWVHELFEKAKVGDPELPRKVAHNFERTVPGVRIQYGEDRQPIFESLASAFSAFRLKIEDETWHSLLKNLGNTEPPSSAKEQ